MGMTNLVKSVGEWEWTQAMKENHTDILLKLLEL